MSFTAYDLRTTDLEGAAAFYAAVAGLRLERTGDAAVFHAGGRRVGALAALPQQARQHGAPAHWLGQIAVDDPAAAAARLVELGSQRLGPPQRSADGRALAIVRDPLGAVVAVSEGAADAPSGVAWHELHTTDHERAWSIYAELTRWHQTRRVDLGAEPGGYQMFALDDAGDIGAMTDAARAPHIHTHWLFYFAVDDLDAALATVRSLGGSVAAGPAEHPSGGRSAACEDPQGAAFGLLQR